MTVGFLISSAFMMGLVGSLHCVGMCGGIVSVLGCGQSGESGQHDPSKNFMSLMAYHSAYNIGRISSYGIIGMIIAFVSMKSVAMAPVVSFPVGMVISGVFMVLLGLYISGWWRILGQLERVGGYVWHYIKPFGQYILPVKSLPHAFLLGLVWGWLPCGLVYSALGLAAVSLNPLWGGIIMVSFGLGTLPMLLAIGSSAGKLNSWLQNIQLRRIAGLSIIVMGMVSLFSAFQSHQHGHRHQHSTTWFLGQEKLRHYVTMTRGLHHKSLKKEGIGHSGA